MLKFLFVGYIIGCVIIACVIWLLESMDRIHFTQKESLKVVFLWPVAVVLYPFFKDK